MHCGKKFAEDNMLRREHVDVGTKEEEIVLEDERLVAKANHHKFIVCRKTYFNSGV